MEGRAMPQTPRIRATTSSSAARNVIARRDPPSIPRPISSLIAWKVHTMHDVKLDFPKVDAAFSVRSVVFWVRDKETDQVISLGNSFESLNMPPDPLFSPITELMTSDVFSRVMYTSAASGLHNSGNSAWPTPIITDMRSVMHSYKQSQWSLGMVHGDRIHFRFKWTYRPSVSERVASMIEKAHRITMPILVRFVNNLEFPKAGPQTLLIEAGEPFHGGLIPHAMRMTVVKELRDLVKTLHRDCAIIHGNINEKSFVWTTCPTAGRVLKLVGFSCAHVVGDEPPRVVVLNRDNLSPKRIKTITIKSALNEVVPPPTMEDDEYALALLQLSILNAPQLLSQTLPRVRPTWRPLLSVEDPNMREELIDIFHRGGVSWKSMTTTCNSHPSMMEKNAEEATAKSTITNQGSSKQTSVAEPAKKVTTGTVNEQIDITEWANKVAIETKVVNFQPSDMAKVVDKETESTKKPVHVDEMATKTIDVKKTGPMPTVVTKPIPVTAAVINPADGASIAQSIKDAKDTDIEGWELVHRGESEMGHVFDDSASGDDFERYTEWDDLEEEV